LPELKYPKEFMSPNSGIAMHQPDGKPAGGTADANVPPQPAKIPVEQLIQSMQPEKPLVVSGGFGGASSSAASN
jgi:hypothetical protein